MDKETYKHSFYNQIKENLGLAVFSTGYQKCEKKYLWGPGVRGHFLIHYVAKGKGTFISNGLKYTLAKGDLFIIYPSQLITYQADEQEPWEYFWVGFQGTEAKRIVSQTAFSKTNPIISVDSNNKLEKYLLSIYESSGNTSSADITMLGYLYLFLGELVRVSQQNRPQQKINQEYIYRALKYIEFNYAYPISLDDISEFVGISRSHLYRIFMKHTNISPNEYLQKYRINEACVLLRNNKFTMSEVASSVGFTDPLYFSRVFKKMRGESPSKYVERIRDEEQIK